jgi:hypothetical protein
MDISMVELLNHLLAMDGIHAIIKRINRRRMSVELDPLRPRLIASVVRARIEERGCQIESDLMTTNVAKGGAIPSNRDRVTEEF